MPLHSIMSCLEVEASVNVLGYITMCMRPVMHWPVLLECRVCGREGCGREE